MLILTFAHLKSHSHICTFAHLKSHLHILIFSLSLQKTKKEKMTIDNTQLAEQLRMIKRSLRGVMNGPVSASMREKGLNYKIIFGLSLIHI